MTEPDVHRPGTARWRLAGIGLLAAGVAAALYVAGRLHQPDYTFSLFGANPVPLKSLLATIALALAGLQVLLALWMYRRLPLPGPPRRVPVAVHCLIAYGVQLTSARVAIHSVAGCFSTAPSPPRFSRCTAAGCPDGSCPWPEAFSRSSSASCGTPGRCGTTTATSSPACKSRASRREDV